MRTCGIEGCEKKHEARGWCNMHYLKWRTHGAPEGGASRFSTPEEAFAARTTPRGGCLEWTGSKNDKGYGQIVVDGRIVPAHRYAWMREHGPIPDGEVIDHKCFNPACVKISHLRPATVGENNTNCPGPRSTNLLGYRNISRHGNGYQVRVVHRGEMAYSAYFSDLEAAISAAAAKRAEVYGAYAGRG